MEATLYGVLGVDPDADEQTIVRAYRERAKRHHPDVSDDADAEETFKRLTTAKEVLTDDVERARYDRLGHEAYVREHASDGAWGVADDGTATGGASDAARQYVDANAQSRSEPTARASTRSRQTRGGSTAYGTAASYYKPGERIDPEGPTTFDTVLDAVRAVGPWLAVHAVLLVSAVALALVLLTGGIVGGAPSFAGTVLAVSMVGITLFVSTLHVVSRIYA